MRVQGLGYIGVDATDFGAWRAFATDVLAMQIAERGADALALRMDDRCHRVLVQRSDHDGPGFFGFQTAGPEALRETVRQLEAVRVAVTPASEKELMLRGVEGMAWCRDPAGNRIEFFHGLAAGEGPFKAPRPHGGFRCGPLGMGHAVFHVQDIDAMSAFYRDTLGFRLTDYMVKPYRLMFLRANPRHHSVALLQSKLNGVHHVLFEVLALDDVGRAYDFAQERWRIGQTLGRHSNDWTLSFYAFCPAGFMMEYGWGGRTVDEATWTPREVTHGGSMWGHDRLWLDEERRRTANEVRRATILSGLGAPLQVTRGQFNEVE
ncbi:MAG: VOC family protein [Betaproteobacteria bacterium]|nr:VOC family protein [Betaproteobacteria bacterium]